MTHALAHHWHPSRSAALRATALSVVLAVNSLAASASAMEITYQNWVMGILRFVEWSDTTTATTLTLCQRAQDEGLNLRRDESLANRRLALIKVNSPRETGPCSVFLVGEMSAQEITSWLTAFSGRQVLTIGVGRRFCEQGGAMCFVATPLSQPRPLLNFTALRSAGLRVHTPLYLSSFRASKT